MGTRHFGPPPEADAGADADADAGADADADAGAEADAEAEAEADAGADAGADTDADADAGAIDGRPLTLPAVRMATELRFEEPHAEFQNSYRELSAEFVSAGEQLVPFSLTFPNQDFPALLAQLAAYEKGEGIPPGFVPHSTYWLVSDGVVVGVTNLRHRLTDSLRREGGNIGYGVRPSARRRGFAHELLRGALARARELGLADVLLTCGKTNTGSVRTILGNGGVFLSEAYLPERGEVVQRYRIDIA